MEKTCMEYPYTVDLCMHVLELKGDPEKLFTSRRITDEPTKDKILEAAQYYRHIPDQVPDWAKKMADAHHLLNDSFPDIPLFLQDIKHDEMVSYFFFTTAADRTEPTEAIPCPSWLIGDFRTLWLHTAPRMVGVALNRWEHSAAIAMEGYHFSIREYFAKDIEAAIRRQTVLIDEGKVRSSNITSSRSVTTKNRKPNRRNFD